MKILICAWPAGAHATGSGAMMLELALIILAYLFVVNFVLPKLGFKPG